MNFHTFHPLQPFWNIAAAPLQTQALEQALTQGLFERLRQPSSAATLASGLGLDLAAVTLWLDLLWSLELLAKRVPAEAKRPPEYASTPLALQYFADHGDQACAQAWLYRARFLARFAEQWPSLLRQGFDPRGEAAPKGRWSHAAREQIAQEQRAVTVPAVLGLMSRLPPLPARGRLLDLGCGPGLVGIALAQTLPGWHGVLCDQAETAEVAQENIQAAGLLPRLQSLACDLNSDAFGHAYDLIWCSAVLHFLRDPHALIRKAAAALNPGGLMLMAHAEQVDEPALAARVLPFYGTVALRSHPLPRPGEIAGMMADAGLHDIQSLGHIDFPMAPVHLHMARRA